MVRARENLIAPHAPVPFACHGGSTGSTASHASIDADIGHGTAQAMFQAASYGAIQSIASRSQLATSCTLEELVEVAIGSGRFRGSGIDAVLQRAVSPHRRLERPASPHRRNQRAPTPNDCSSSGDGLSIDSEMEQALSASCDESCEKALAAPVDQLELSQNGSFAPERMANSVRARVPQLDILPTGMEIVDGVERSGASSASDMSCSPAEAISKDAPKESHYVEVVLPSWPPFVSSPVTNVPASRGEVAELIEAVQSGDGTPTVIGQDVPFSPSLVSVGMAATNPSSDLVCQDNQASIGFRPDSGKVVANQLRSEILIVAQPVTCNDSSGCVESEVAKAGGSCEDKEATDESGGVACLDDEASAGNIPDAIELVAIEESSETITASHPVTSSGGSARLEPAIEKAIGGDPASDPEIVPSSVVARPGREGEDSAAGDDSPEDGITQEVTAASPAENTEAVASSPAAKMEVSASFRVGCLGESASPLRPLGPSVGRGGDEQLGTNSDSGDFASTLAPVPDFASEHSSLLAGDVARIQGLERYAELNNSRVLLREFVADKEWWQIQMLATRPLHEYIASANLAPLAPRELPVPSAEPLHEPVPPTFFFQAGMLAQIHGLQKRPELNTQHVRLLEYIESKDWWNIEVLDGEMKFIGAPHLIPEVPKVMPDRSHGNTLGSESRLPGGSESFLVAHLDDVPTTNLKIDEKHLDELVRAEVKSRVGEVLSEYSGVPATNYHLNETQLVELVRAEVNQCIASSPSERPSKPPMDSSSDELAAHSDRPRPLTTLERQEVLALVKDVLSSEFLRDELQLYLTVRPVGPMLELEPTVEHLPLLENLARRLEVVWETRLKLIEVDVRRALENVEKLSVDILDIKDVLEPGSRAPKSPSSSAGAVSFEREQHEQTWLTEAGTGELARSVASMLLNGADHTAKEELRCVLNEQSGQQSSIAELQEQFGNSCRKAESMPRSVSERLAIDVEQMPKDQQGCMTPSTLAGCASGGEEETLCNSTLSTTVCSNLYRLSSLRLADFGWNQCNESVGWGPPFVAMFPAEEHRQDIAQGASLAVCLGSQSGTQIAGLSERLEKVLQEHASQLCEQRAAIASMSSQCKKKHCILQAAENQRTEAAAQWHAELKSEDIRLDSVMRRIKAELQHTQEVALSKIGADFQEYRGRLEDIAAVERQDARRCPESETQKFEAFRTEMQHKFEQVFKTMDGVNGDPVGPGTAQLARRVDECEVRLAQQTVEGARRNAATDRLRESVASEATKVGRLTEELYGRCAALADEAAEMRSLLDERTEELARGHRKSAKEIRQVLDGRFDEVSRSYRKTAYELRQIVEDRVDDLKQNQQIALAETSEAIKDRMLQGSNRRLIKIGHGRIQSIVSKIIGDMTERCWRFCFQSWRDLVDVRLRAKTFSAMARGDVELEQASLQRERGYQELSAAVELLRQEAHSRAEEIVRKQQAMRTDMELLRQESSDKADDGARSHRELADQLKAYESRRERDLNSSREDKRADAEQIQAALLSDIRACQTEVRSAAKAAEASNAHLEQLAGRMAELQCVADEQKTAAVSVQRLQRELENAVSALHAHAIEKVSARRAEAVEFAEVTRQFREMREAQPTLSEAHAEFAELTRQLRDVQDALAKLSNAHAASDGELQEQTRRSVQLQQRIDEVLEAHQASQEIQHENSTALHTLLHPSEAWDRSKVERMPQDPQPLAEGLDENVEAQTHQAINQVPETAPLQEPGQCPLTSLPDTKNQQDHNAHEHANLLGAVRKQVKAELQDALEVQKSVFQKVQRRMLKVFTGQLNEALAPLKAASAVAEPQCEQTPRHMRVWEEHQAQLQEQWGFELRDEVLRVLQAQHRENLEIREYMKSLVGDVMRGQTAQALMSGCNTDGRDCASPLGLQREMMTSSYDDDDDSISPAPPPPRAFNTASGLPWTMAINVGESVDKSCVATAISQAMPCAQATAMFRPRSAPSTSLATVPLHKTVSAKALRNASSRIETHNDAESDPGIFDLHFMPCLDMEAAVAAARRRPRPRTPTGHGRPAPEVACRTVGMPERQLQRFLSD